MVQEHSGVLLHQQREMQIGTIPMQGGLNQARSDTICWHHAEKMHHNAIGVVNAVVSHPSDIPVTYAFRYLSQR